MKKIYITLLLIAAVQLSAFAYESYPGEDIVKKIDDAYIKANPKKMEKLWNEFCGINTLGCEALQTQYNDALFNAKVRQQEKRRQMWMGIVAGTVKASNDYFQSIEEANNRSLYLHAVETAAKYNSPTSFTVYDQYGIKPIGKVKVNYGPFGGF